MKQIIAFFAAFVFLGAVRAQSVQGTIKAGSLPNSVVIAIRPSATFTGRISAVEFTLQVPSTVIPAPVPVIRTNFLSANIPGYVPTLITSEGGFTNYLFASVPTSTPNFDFIANTEVNVLEVEFTGGPATGLSSQVRLASLPNGGSNSQQYFYIEVNGLDRTNQTAMFYGATASNNPAGYTAYSFVSVSNIVLPVNWLNFTAVRQQNDVQLRWEVSNELGTKRYDVEISTNGVDFATVATLARTTGNGTKTYSLLDKQVVRYNGKALHYRIKQYDDNGKYSYSPTKTIRLDVKGETALFPNPAKDGFTLTIPYLNPDQQRVQLHLVNALGQTIDRKDITRFAAANYYYSLQSALVVSGEYLLKIYEDGELTETKRVLIKK